MSETSNKFVADAIVDLLSDHYGEDAGLIAMLISAHLLDFASEQYASLAASREYTAAVAGALKASCCGRRLPPETIALARAAIQTAAPVPTDHLM